MQAGWLNCADAQADLRLCYLHIWQTLRFSHDMAHILFATVYVTDADVTLCDGLWMFAIKTTYQVYKSTWIALLELGFGPVKPWLLIEYSTHFYAVILYWTICSLLTRSLANKEIKRFPFLLRFVWREVCVAHRRRKTVFYYMYHMTVMLFSEITHFIKIIWSHV